MLFLNVFLHGLNSVACLVDIFINHRPWHALHFTFAVGFGLYYALFSLIYWACGGLGMCVVNEDTGLEECEEAIYPILDWGNSPGLAVGTICFGVLVLPLLHGFWYGLHRVRILWAGVGACCKSDGIAAT